MLFLFCTCQATHWYSHMTINLLEKWMKSPWNQSDAHFHETFLLGWHPWWQLLEFPMPNCHTVCSFRCETLCGFTERQSCLQTEHLNECSGAFYRKFEEENSARQRQIRVVYYALNKCNESRLHLFSSDFLFNDRQWVQFRSLISIPLHEIWLITMLGNLFSEGGFCF